MWGHMTHFWILKPPNISGTIEVRNFKFGTEMDGSEYEKNAKWSCGLTWSTFRILGPLISRERLNIKFGTDMTAVSANEKNTKIGQKMSCGGHVTYFGILWPPNISGTGKARNFKFGSEMDGS